MMYFMLFFFINLSSKVYYLATLVFIALNIKNVSFIIPLSALKAEQIKKFPFLRGIKGEVDWMAILIELF